MTLDTGQSTAAIVPDKLRQATAYGFRPEQLAALLSSEGFRVETSMVELWAAGDLTGFLSRIHGTALENLCYAMEVLAERFGRHAMFVFATRYGSLGPVTMADLFATRNWHELASRVEATRAGVGIYARAVTAEEIAAARSRR